MKGDKELFDLAKQYVMLDAELQKYELPPEHELEEIKNGLEEIRNIILAKGYNVNKFMEFQNLYRKMSIKDYYEYIKTLK